jgi:S1-C subfamily serine protease
VYPGSAGAAAGLEAGDVIVGVNGERVADREALHNFEGLQGVGTRVSLDVLRNGKPLQVTAALREQPKAVEGAALDPRLAGATFTELPERLRQAGVDGVLVEKVARGSRAAANGLQGGDVVIAANSGRFDDLPGFRLSFTDQRAETRTAGVPQLVLRVVRGNAQGDLLIQ